MPQKPVVESKKLQTAAQEGVIVNSERQRKSREKQGWEQYPEADGQEEVWRSWP